MRHVSLLTLIFWVATASVPGHSYARQGEELEKEVLELLVGEEGVRYAHDRPDVAGLYKIGEKAIPIILKHAPDNAKSYRAASLTLWSFAFSRMKLPEAAVTWIVSESKKDKVSLPLVAAMGELGLEDRIPSLEEIAKGEDDRRACVAVQAIAAMGTETACKSLERLQTGSMNRQACVQCKTLLDALYYPFKGSGADAAILNEIENGDEMRVKEIEYSALGGWLWVYESLLKRLVRAKRTDLLPKLRDIAKRIIAKDGEALSKGSERLLRVLVTINLLGGELADQEKQELQDQGLIEKPGK